MRCLHPGETIISVVSSRSLLPRVAISMSFTQRVAAVVERHQETQQEKVERSLRRARRTSETSLQKVSLRRCRVTIRRES